MIHYKIDRVTLHHGDCAKVLKELPAESVNCVVTSPPYWGLRDYGNSGQLGLEATPEQYVAQMVLVFREVRRVLRDDGTLWLNLGDSYMQDKNLCGIPWRVAFALQADGWYLRQDIIWHKPNPMPESVTDRCTKAHEYIFLLTKAAKYYYNTEAIKEAAVTPVGGSPRAFGSANQVGTKRKDIGETFTDTGRRNKHSVWKVNTKPYKGAHFATFPPKLIEPCIMAGCPEGGTVLDPFLGSGTTGAVAQKNQCRFVGIELNEDYLQLASKRFTQGVLF